MFTDTPIQVGGNSEELSPTTEWVAKKVKKSKKFPSWNSKRLWKLPIRPPKLRSANKTITGKAQRISYGSLARIWNLTESNLVPLEYTNSSMVGGGSRK